MLQELEEKVHALTEESTALQTASVSMNVRFVVSILTLSTRLD